MTIYLLKPCSSKSQDWTGSDYIEYLIIQADHEAAARECAANHTWIASEVGDDRKPAKMGGAWLNPELVDCNELNEDEVESYMDYASEEDQKVRGPYILKEGAHK